MEKNKERLTYKCTITDFALRTSQENLNFFNKYICNFSTSGPA